MALLRKPGLLVCRVAITAKEDTLCPRGGQDKAGKRVGLKLEHAGPRVNPSAQSSFQIRQDWFKLTSDICQPNVHLICYSPNIICKWTQFLICYFHLSEPQFLYLEKGDEKLIELRRIIWDNMCKALGMVLPPIARNRNVTCDDYSFVIGAMWVITKNQPPMNSSPEPTNNARCVPYDRLTR